MKLPLCVDLDGTLIYNDVTLISYGDFIYGHQFRILKALFWLLKGGRALLKYELAKREQINPSELMYNEKLLQYIREYKTLGGGVFLVTGCNEKYATCIADHLEIFDEVLASNKNINLIAAKKEQILVNKFGEQGFVYIGNSRDDLQVWKHAAKIIVVNPASGVINKLKNKEYTLFE